MENKSKIILCTTVFALASCGSGSVNLDQSNGVDYGTPSSTVQPVTPKDGLDETNSVDGFVLLTSGSSRTGSKFTVTDNNGTTTAGEFEDGDWVKAPSYIYSVNEFYQTELEGKKQEEVETLKVALAINETDVVIEDGKIEIDTNNQSSDDVFVSLMDESGFVKQVTLSCEDQCTHDLGNLESSEVGGASKIVAIESSDGYTFDTFTELSHDEDMVILESSLAADQTGNPADDQGEITEMIIERDEQRNQLLTFRTELEKVNKSVEDEKRRISSSLGRMRVERDRLLAQRSELDHNINLLKEGDPGNLDTEMEMAELITQRQQIKLDIHELMLELADLKAPLLALRDIRNEFEAERVAVQNIRSDMLVSRWEMLNSAELEEVYCASTDNRYHFCKMNREIESLSVLRKVSRESCNLEQSYGKMGVNLWVNHGCRARFLLKINPSF